ncbi:MAG: carboxypeptidase-like regulatory domain-containing protein [Bryobacteraceae bacterium]
MPSAILNAVLLLPLVAQIDAETPQGRLRGHVVDASGGAIPAIIRVIRPDTNTVVLRFRAEEDGTFQTGPLAPSVYSLTAFSQGFRRRELRKIVIKPGHIADLGEITLDISGCDTPGTNCDYIGEVPDRVKRIIAESNVTLRPTCAVDLDRKGETVCPEQEDDIQMARDSDIRLAKLNGTLYLVAVNGAALSEPYASTSDCSRVTYGNDSIPVVGLGPGVDCCVRTKRGSVSHVFFTEDVENESTTVALSYVTRRRE